VTGEYADLLAVCDADAAATRPRVAEFRRLCPAVTAEDLDAEFAERTPGLTLRLVGHAPARVARPQGGGAA